MQDQAMLTTVEMVWVEDSVVLVVRQGGVKTAAWLQYRTTWLQYRTTWLQYRTTWLQYRTTWLQYRTTWLDLRPLISVSISLIFP